MVTLVVTAIAGGRLTLLSSKNYFVTCILVAVAVFGLVLHGCLHTVVTPIRTDYSLTSVVFYG